jgi:hypothetical protein
VKASETEHQVKVWSFRDILLESYRYAPGPAESLPTHSHEDYQFCLSLDFPGEYRYRGSSYGVPVGSLSVIHPGEMHSVRDPEDRRKTANYKLMYTRPDLLRNAASEVAGRNISEPFFPSPIILDGDLGRRFLDLHVSLAEPSSELERGGAPPVGSHATRVALRRHPSPAKTSSEGAQGRRPGTRLSA